MVVAVAALGELAVGGAQRALAVGGPIVTLFAGVDVAVAAQRHRIGGASIGATVGELALVAIAVTGGAVVETLRAVGVRIALGVEHAVGLARLGVTVFGCAVGAAHPVAADAVPNHGRRRHVGLGVDPHGASRGHDPEAPQHDPATQPLRACAQRHAPFPHGPTVGVCTELSNLGCSVGHLPNARPWFDAAWEPSVCVGRRVAPLVRVAQYNLPKRHRARAARCAVAAGRVTASAPPTHTEGAGGRSHGRSGPRSRQNAALHPWLRWHRATADPYTPRIHPRGEPWPTVPRFAKL